MAADVNLPSEQRSVLDEGASTSGSGKYSFVSI